MMRLLPCYPPHIHIPSSMLKQSKAKPHQLPPCHPSSVPCLSCSHRINFCSKSRILLQRLGRFIPCASLARRSHQHPTNPLKLAQGTKHLISVTVPQHMSCIHVQAVSPAPCPSFAAAVLVVGGRADPVPHDCRLLW